MTPVVHAAATWFMVGLIWTTQLVHYPLFRRVGESSFAEYHAGHTTRMGTLLALPAIVEIVTAAALFLARRDVATFAAGSALAAIWMSTALVHAPFHARLSRSADRRLMEGLSRANWWRTAMWTGRGVAALAFI